MALISRTLCWVGFVLKAFDVADGAADFYDDDVICVAYGLDRLFYLVGDVRDHLDGVSEVIAPPLL
jgi:hypothetical protein